MNTNIMAQRKSQQLLSANKDGRQNHNHTNSFYNQNTNSGESRKTQNPLSAQPLRSKIGSSTMRDQTINLINSQ